jgi:hypothetical protein
MVSPGWKLSWAFASEARQKLAISLFTMANPNADAARKAKALAGTWIVGGMGAALLRAISRDIRNGEDDEWFDERNWNPARLALMSLCGPFQGIPVLGELVQGAVFAATGQYVADGNLFSSVMQAGGATRNLDDWFTGDRDAAGIIKDTEAILSGMGVFNETISAAASLSHLARDLFGVADNLSGN